MVPTLSTLLIILTIIIPPSNGLSFNFTTFTAGQSQNITYEQAFPADNAIQLTKNLLGSDLKFSFGRATYHSPLPLWDPISRNLTDFQTHFTFTIFSQFKGLTRDLQQLNTSGNRFVAVEFDIFSNSWDPVGKHVGIDFNSMASAKTITWVWDLYSERTMLEQGPDSRLGGQFVEVEMERLMLIGLCCSHPDPKLRPSIRQALQVLNFEAPLPIVPMNMPVATFVSAPSSMDGTTTSTSSSLVMDLTRSIDISNTMAR
ncbi:Lectin-related protein (Fragment) [Linum perenne]